MSEGAPLSVDAIKRLERDAKSRPQNEQIALLMEIRDLLRELLVATRNIDTGG